MGRRRERIYERQHGSRDECTSSNLSPAPDPPTAREETIRGHSGHSGHSQRWRPSNARVMTDGQAIENNHDSETEIRSRSNRNGNEYHHHAGSRSSGNGRNNHPPNRHRHHAKTKVKAKKKAWTKHSKIHVRCEPVSCLLQLFHLATINIGHRDMGFQRPVSSKIGIPIQRRGPR